MKQSLFFVSTFVLSIVLPSCGSKDVNLEPIPIIQAQVSAESNQQTPPTNIFQNGESTREVTLNNNQIIITTDGNQSGKRITLSNACVIAGAAGPGGTEHYLLLDQDIKDSSLIAKHYFSDDGLLTYTSGKRDLLFRQDALVCPDNAQAQIISTSDIAHFFWTTEAAVHYGQFQYRDSSGIEPLVLSGPTNRVSQFSATSLDGRLGLAWLQEDDTNKQLIFQERAEPGYHMRTLVLDSYEKTSAIENISISASDSTFTIISQGSDESMSYSVTRK